MVKEFVRKWGFEPSFWWQTGLENLIEPKLYHYQSTYIVDSKESVQWLRGIEPFVDKIYVDNEELRNTVKTFLEEESKKSYWDLTKKLTIEKASLENTVTVRQIPKQSTVDNLKKLHKFFGTLIFTENIKKLGEYNLGGFLVNIQNTKKSIRTGEDINYLLEQKKFTYE